MILETFFHREWISDCFFLPRKRKCTDRAKSDADDDLANNWDDDSIKL